MIYILVTGFLATKMSTEHTLPVPRRGKMAQHDILIEIGQRAKARAVL